MSSRIADPLARALVVASLVACMLATGCREAPEAATGNAPPVRPAYWDDDDPEELFTPMRGIVVVDRSGEISFEHCVLNAFDGDAGTYWVTPRKDQVQWVIVELPARTKITKVGASTASAAPPIRGTSKLRFESSFDGKTFTELRTVEIALKKNKQTFEVPPTEARFLRVTTLGNHGDPLVTYIPTLHAKGVEIEQPAPVDFGGSWDVNGQRFDLAQDGSALYGIAPMNPPMVFYGAVDGRVARLAWTRGNENGIAWFAVNPSATHLSGIWWWVDPKSTPVLGEAWYGSRRADTPEFTTPIPQIADVHLRKMGEFPLYGMLFRPDGELDVESSRSAIAFVGQALEAFPSYRVRLKVTACDSWDESKNLERSRDRAAKLSAALARAGLPASRLIVEPASRTDLPWLLLRVLFSRVDFSLAGN